MVRAKPKKKSNVFADRTAIRTLRTLGHSTVVVLPAYFLNDFLGWKVGTKVELFLDENDSIVITELDKEED